MDMHQCGILGYLKSLGMTTFKSLDDEIDIKLIANKLNSYLVLQFQFLDKKNSYIV